jgi:hypothetical protein
MKTIAKYKVEEIVDKLTIDLDRYKKAFGILHEYFDSIPSEEKENVDRKLRELDL